MTITIATLRKDSDIGTLYPFKRLTRGSAKDSAANALAKNPAKVIPIWIVAKNLLGSPNNLINCLAFLFPSSAISFILLSFNDINAISDAAKKAFTPIKTNKNKISVIKTLNLP